MAQLEEKPRNPLAAVVASSGSRVAHTPRPERFAVHSGLKLLLAVGLVAAVVLVRQVLILAFLGLLFGVAMSYPVNLMSRFMPRGMAVLASLLLVLGGFTGLGLMCAPVLSEQIQSVAKQAPSAFSKAQQWADHFSKSGPVAGLSKGGKMSSQLGENAGKFLEQGASKILPAAFGAVEGVSEIILILVLAAFLVHQPGAYLSGVRKLVPREGEPAYDEGTRRLARGLRGWVGGIFCAMLIMGTVTAVGLKTAGIENWFLLGVITFLGTFVPYLGAICSAVPGLLMGLSQDSTHFFYAMIVYLGVHLIEGYIVEPYIMKRAVEIRPAMLLVGQAIFGGLLGVMGVVIATPLLVCLQIGVGYFYVERRLGKTPA